MLGEYLQENSLDSNFNILVHQDPSKYSAYRTNGDIIAHRDVDMPTDSDALRWNSKKAPRPVGRKRKPRREEPFGPSKAPVDGAHKHIAAQLMRKVRGKQNALTESLLDNDANGDGSVGHQQLRDGFQFLGLSEGQTDALLER